MRTIINKIRKFWNPIAEEQGKKATAEPIGNAIDFREELIGKIVRNRFFRRYSMDETIDNPFTLWVTTEGPNYQTEVRKPDFIKSLRKAFDDINLSEVGSHAEWIIKTEALPENADFFKIDEGIYLDTHPIAEQQNTEPQILSLKARISIAENSGSLLQQEYLLDAAKQQSWQIGRGEKDGAGTKNHVVISGNEKDKRYENNKYVSNLHAQILFIESKGFCVKSLNDNNRTIIYRNNNRIADLRDLHSVSIPLQDGDFIELGKKVSLKFEIV